MKKFDFLVFIDDDPMTNMFHEIIVKNADVCERFLFFESPVKALDFFIHLKSEEQPQYPEIIFLDINMPELTGWEFIEEYKKIGIAATSKIIMLTTSKHPNDLENSKKEDLVYSLEDKPLNREQILRINSDLKPSLNERK